MPSVVPEAGDSRELWRLFAQGLPVYAKEMGAALAPIAAFFAVFQVTSSAFASKKCVENHRGTPVYLYRFGFVYDRRECGPFYPPAAIWAARSRLWSQSWVLIPIGMLMGWFIVQAEPAVHVLNRQVEELTSGAILARP